VNWRARVARCGGGDVLGVIGCVRGRVCVSGCCGASMGRLRDVCAVVSGRVGCVRGWGLVCVCCQLLPVCFGRKSI
jgi:hypothetical protein